MLKDETSSMAFESVRWNLDRSQLLEIDLEVQFRSYVDGEGSVQFSPDPGDLSFVVTPAQWSIVPL